MQLQLDTSKHRQLNHQGCMTRQNAKKVKLQLEHIEKYTSMTFHRKRFRRIQRYVEHDIPSNTTLGRNLVEIVHSYIPEIKLSVSFIPENIIYD